MTKTQLLSVLDRMTAIVQPWIGVRADIIPPSVTALVPLVNEFQSMLADEPSEITEISSPSAICGLLGCKDQEPHTHGVIERPAVRRSARQDL